MWIDEKGSPVPHVLLGFTHVHTCSLRHKYELSVCFLGCFDWQGQCVYCPISVLGSAHMIQFQIGARAGLITCHWDCYILKGNFFHFLLSPLVFSWAGQKWPSTADSAATSTGPCTGYNKYNHFLIFSPVIGHRVEVHFLQPTLLPCLVEVSDPSIWCHGASDPLSSSNS